MAEQLGRDHDPEMISRRKAAQPMWTVHIDAITPQKVYFKKKVYKGLISHLRVSSFCYTGLSFTSIWLASEIPLLYPGPVGKSWGKFLHNGVYAHMCTKKSWLKTRSRV